MAIGGIVAGAGGFLARAASSSGLFHTKGMAYSTGRFGSEGPRAHLGAFGKIAAGYAAHEGIQGAKGAHKKRGSVR